MFKRTKLTLISTLLYGVFTLGGVGTAIYMKMLIDQSSKDSAAGFEALGYAIFMIFALGYAIVDKILLAGNEGAGDIVNAVRKSESDVCLVRIGKIFLLHNLAGEAHTLSVRKLAARRNLANYISALDFFNGE